MRLTTLVMFGAGYVLGTKAGRERYAQIVTMAEKASRRLDEFSEEHRRDAPGAVREADRDPRRRTAAL